MDDIVTQNQTTGNGGGIYNAAGATLTLSNSEVEENSASGYGGGIENLGALISESSQIFHVNSAKNGGGIANQGPGATTKLQDRTEIGGNVASSNGGGIYTTSGSVSMTGSMGGTGVSYNTAGSGGGIYVGSGKVTLKSQTVTENKATTDDGGGIYIRKGTVKASGAGSFSDNSATNGNGGGVYNFAGSLTLTGFANSPQTIGGNSAINGGGMYLATGSTTTFNGVNVSGNTVTGKGKGVAFENGANMLPNPLGQNDLNDIDDNGNPVQV